MADNTKIEWTDASWSPITGCSPASIGCTHCYARRMSRRLAGRHGYPEAPHHFDVTFHPDRLEQPLKWKKPRKIFVCSMSDLFHEDVDEQWLLDVFGIMSEAYWHTYQILTKRIDRAAEFVSYMEYYILGESFDSAFPNVWLGVTAENQEQANGRIPILLQIPAAKRFVSIEPMLGEIDLGFGPDDNCHWCLGRGEWNIAQSGASEWIECECVTHNKWLSWVIVGAETGPGARKMNLDWARSIRDQCQAAGVPFFFKKDSSGNHELDGRVLEEFPR